MPVDTLRPVAVYVATMILSPTVPPVDPTTMPPSVVVTPSPQPIYVHPSPLPVSIESAPNDWIGLTIAAIAAAATLIGVIPLIWTGVRWAKERARRSAAYEQAAKISARMRPTGPLRGVFVLNRSDAEVYAVKIEIGGDAIERSILPPGKFELGEVSRRDLIPTNEDFYHPDDKLVSIQFTDSVGWTWRRDRTGKLDLLSRANDRSAASVSHDQ